MSPRILYFLADVTIDYSEDSWKVRWQYELVKPTLKGEIDRTGWLKTEYENLCIKFEGMERGIYLIFLEEPGENITNQNSKLVVWGRRNCLRTMGFRLGRVSSI